MAVSPGEYNDSLQRRADYRIELEFREGEECDEPINLTGWTVTAQAWDQGRTTKYADFLVTYANRRAGVVSISLTDDQTAALPDEVFYDVLLTDTNGLKEYYLKGILFVGEGLTT